jgi:hypothetical protein
MGSRIRGEANDYGKISNIVTVAMHLEPTSQWLVRAERIVPVIKNVYTVSQLVER